MLHSLQCLLLLIAVIQFLQFANCINEQSINCPSKYARETQSTNECICMSRNCQGPKCQSGQGFVWYNYRECPTCECIAADKEKLMQAAKKRETQKKRDAAMGKVPVEDLPKVDYSEEREAPPTIAEWLDDNSRILFAVIASLVAIIVFAFIIFTQLSTKSAIPTKTTATESVAKDSVNDNVKGKEKGKDTKIDSHKNDKDD